jgi:hypothetical protein
MSFELVVEWQELYPLSSTEWELALQDVMATLREHARVRYRQQDDQGVDVLIVAYMAGDHERVLRDRSLENLMLDRLDLRNVSVLLAACARRKPALSMDSVRELLIEQVPVAGRRRPLRAASTEDLNRGGQEIIATALGERQFAELPPSHSSERSKVAPQYVAPKRRIENI